MKIGDKVKINKRAFEKFIECFPKDKDELKKSLKTKEIYEVEYYKESTRNPADNLCKKCKLSDECEFDVLDFKGNGISVWCAKLFEPANKQPLEGHPKNSNRVSGN